MNSSETEGPYVHHCASMKEAQVSFRYLMDEKKHRTPSVHIGTLVREKYPSDCCTMAYEHYCTGSSTHLVHRPIYGKAKGHRRTCPVCSGSDALRRASKTYHALHGFKWKRLRHMELTAPHDYVTRKDSDETISLKVERFFRMCWFWMAQCFAGEAYIFFFHHWASSDPFGPPHFHMHIISLCTIHSRDAERQISVEHLDAVLSVNELNSLRAVWRRILGHDGNVNVFYRYAPRWPKGRHGGPTRLMHRLVYCYRAYIQDANRHSLVEGFTLTDEQDYWLKWHMRKWKRRVRRYGVLSTSKQKQYINMHKVKQRIELDAEKAKVLYCPECMYPIENKSRSCDSVTLDGTLLAVREVFVKRRPPSSVMYDSTPSWLMTKPKNSGYQNK